MTPSEVEFIAGSANPTLKHKRVAREVRLLFRDHPERVILPWLHSAGKMIGFTGESIDHGAGKILSDLLMSDGWMHFHHKPVISAGLATVNAWAWSEKARRCFTGRTPRAERVMNYKRNFEEHLREKWRKSDREFIADVEVGDVVQYSVKFLRSTGQVTSNDPRVHGKAVVVEKMNGGMLKVVWEHEMPGAEAHMVHAANLGYPTTPRTAGGL